MSDKTKRAVSALMLVGIVVLVVINVNLNNRLKNLEWSLSNMSAGYSQWHNEINSLRWDISNKIDSINEQVMQNARLSFDESVLIQRYDVTSSTAEIEVSFHLKEYSVGETVVITARGQSNQTYNAKTIRSDTGRFSANMTLPVQDNYTVTFTTDGGTIRSEELMRFDLADRLTGYERFKYNFTYGHSSGGNQPSTLAIQPDFSNNTQGNAALIINEIYLSLESNGEPVMTWNLLPYLQNTVGMQVLALGEYNRNDFEIIVDSETGQVKPNGWFTAVARLTIHDNLGLKYERTDQVYIYVSNRPNSGGGGGTVSAPALPVTDGSGYEWGVFRIVRD